MEKGILRNLTKFIGKHLCQSLFFNKVAGLRPATSLKKRLWRSCFPVNLVKFLRTRFLQNTPGRLLLSQEKFWSSFNDFDFLISTDSCVWYKLSLFRAWLIFFWDNNSSKNHSDVSKSSYLREMGKRISMQPINILIARFWYFSKLKVLLWYIKKKNPSLPTSKGKCFTTTFTKLMHTTTLWVLLFHYCLSNIL